MNYHTLICSFILFILIHNIFVINCFSSHRIINACLHVGSNDAYCTDFHLEKYVYLGSKTYVFLLVGIILVFTQRAFNAFIKFRIFQKYLEWVGKQTIFLPGLRLDLKVLENFVSNTYWMRQKSSWKSFLRGFWLDEGDMRRSIEAKSWDNGICIKIRKLFNCESFDLAFRVWRKWYLQCSLSAATVSVDFNVLLNYLAIAVLHENGRSASFLHWWMHIESLSVFY